MIVLAIADIHGKISWLEKISEELSAADVILLIGDLTHFGREKEAGQVIKSIRKRSSRVFAVSGNCDYPEVENYLSKESLSLHRRNFVIDGIGITGVGGSLPCPVTTPNQFFESDFEQYLAESLSQLPPEIPMILVSHQPPFQTITDRITSGNHVGSRAVRRFIERYTPLICFTGHIHEGVGIDTIGTTISDQIEELEIRDIKP